MTVLVPVNIIYWVRKEIKCAITKKKEVLKGWE
jgi:hypothetical protein